MNHRVGYELKLQICGPGNNNVFSPGPGWRRGIPNLSWLGSTFEDAAVPSTTDCLFPVSSAPGAELAVAVVQAEAACLHQARNIQYKRRRQLKRFGPDPHPEKRTASY
jgi:hypothetical protein